MNGIRTMPTQSSAQMMVWSRHDFTQSADETADGGPPTGRSETLQRDQIEVWINEGGAGGEALG